MDLIDNANVARDLEKTNNYENIFLKSLSHMSLRAKRGNLLAFLSARIATRLLRRSSLQ